MRPPTEQRVGLVVDALVAICKAIPDANGFDGPALQDTTRQDTVVVGDKRFGGYTVDLIPQDTFGGHGFGYLERITVALTFLSWVGDDDDVKAERDRVIEMIGLLRTAIDPQQGDQTLGDACGEAYLGRQAWLPENDQAGASVGASVLVIAETLI